MTDLKDIEELMVNSMLLAERADDYLQKVEKINKTLSKFPLWVLHEYAMKHGWTRGATSIGGDVVYVHPSGETLSIPTVVCVGEEIVQVLVGLAKALAKPSSPIVDRVPEPPPVRPVARLTVVPHQPRA